MKKIKLFMITVAISIGVFGALANRQNSFCETQQQYKKIGSSFMPVGQYGIDYYCYNTAGNCTYWEVSPGSYAPCRTGAFTWAH